MKVQANVFAFPGEGGHTCVRTRMWWLRGKKCVLVCCVKLKKVHGWGGVRCHPAPPSALTRDHQAKWHECHAGLPVTICDKNREGVDGGDHRHEREQLDKGDGSRAH